MKKPAVIANERKSKVVNDFVSHRGSYIRVKISICEKNECIEKETECFGRKLGGLEYYLNKNISNKKI